MSKNKELENVILLKGTFLVDVNKEEAKSKSGLVVSSRHTQRTGTIVACNPLDVEGVEVDYQVGDKVLLNINYDATSVEVGGEKFELCSRQNIHLILERTKE